jgi:hypothetical protein
MSQGESFCSVCSRPISGGELLYTGQGNPVCPQCNSRIELHNLDVRAAGNITNAAIGCLVVAVISYIFNPFFILTILSIGSGVYALKSLAPANDRFAQHVAQSRGWIMAAAIIGLVIDGIRLLLVILALTLFAVR